jgi:hypothetical protein
MWLVSGLLLVGAGLLKAVELATEPAVTLVTPFGRYFFSVETGVELTLGFLILSGRFRRVLRWFVLFLFIGFTGYSLYIATTGAVSCGCFGTVKMNPWWTFGLDFVVVLGLLISMIIERYLQLKTANELQLAMLLRRRYSIAFVTGTAALMVALHVRYFGSRTTTAAALPTSVGEVVFLEPDQWVGQRLPIADSVSLDLSEGQWTVMLHRHDCSVCQEMVLQFEQRAENGERLALLEVPPYGNFAQRKESCHYGRLKDDHEWFVQTPVEIHLQDGLVTSAKTYGH